MVNELITLSAALEKAGISPENWHPQLRPLPNASKKKPCFRIVLTKEGRVSEISEIDLDLVPLLKKYEPSNGDSFPGFNINPLYRLAIDKNSDQGKQTQKLFKAWRNEKKPTPVDMELLRSWICEENNNWGKKQTEKLSRCMGKVANSIRSMLDPSKDSALYELVERTQFTKDDFRTHLIEYLQALEPFPAGLLRLLIHEGDVKKRAEQDCGTASVFLEIEGWERLEPSEPIASQKSIDRLNDAILKDTNGKLISSDKADISAPDAYGMANIGNLDKMPDVKLPVLGGVKLRAMNSESPCQFRYSTIDADSFSVGGQSRRQAKGALEWLAREEHGSLTWCRSGLKELTFIYPEALPETPIQMAALFTPTSNNLGFTHTAADVTKALKGQIAKEKNDIPINVFALRKMDKARTKIVFDRRYTAKGLIEAASTWQLGCSNVPKCIIRHWGAHKGEVVNGELTTPYPLEISKCLNRIWQMDGVSEFEGHEFEPSAGILLLLDRLTKSMVSHYLSIAVNNGTNLFRHLGGELNRGQVIAASGGIQRYKLILPTILGLLLFKLNINKEHYMKQTPFLIGQLLKLSDEIHALYCEIVRDRNYPQQLIGNALLTTASDSPKQALATLCSRLTAYLGWAKSYSAKGSATSEEFTPYKKARWLLGLYASVADQLAECTIPERFTDADRAQLLLGYLASHPKKETLTTPPTEN